MKARNLVKNGIIFFSGAFMLAVLILGTIPAIATVPYITKRVNLTPTGTQVTEGNVQSPPRISQDGQYVAFATTSSDIVAGDTNGAADIFVRDMSTNVTVMASLANDGTQIPASTGDGFVISANGRYVVFNTNYSGVVSGDTNNVTDIFVRDLKNNTTERISVTSTGAQANKASARFDISATGRYVVFDSLASNLSANDTNSNRDIFVRDREKGTTTLLSKDSMGAVGNGLSASPSISCDGAHIAFYSTSTNLSVNDTNGKPDIFLVDRVSDDAVSNITPLANGSSDGPEMSCNGESIVFESSASNLVANDTNGLTDIFSYNTVDDVHTRVSVSSSGVEMNSGYASLRGKSIDFSGRYVAFASNATNLVASDTNGQFDVFLHDMKDGTTQIISKRSSTVQTNKETFYYALSLDGRGIVFTTSDSGLVSSDTNTVADVFLSETGI